VFSIITQQYLHAVLQIFMQLIQRNLFRKLVLVFSVC